MGITQFTYTACQRPGPYDTVPGWKVKQVDPSDARRETVQLAVRTLGTFRPPTVSALATMAEIEALPRRLRLDRLNDAERSLSHIAAAGRDHTNREAFFAQGLVVSTSEGIPLPGNVVGAPAGAVPRPADLWSAQGWLAPFGATEIEDATFAELPRISDFSPLDPDMRVDFPELHPGQRPFVFAAVEHALRGGRPLVVAGSPVETAMWVSIVTHLMLPTAGWSFEFSTFEQADALPALVPGTTLVIGIAGEDAAAARASLGEQILLLESDDEPQPLGDSAFRLPDGTELPIGPWARLAERVCVGGLEDQVRLAVDELAAEVGRTTDPAPLWGLGAATLLVAARTSPRPLELEVMAAELATATFPLGAGMSDATANRLIDGILDVLGDSLAVFRQLLRTADNTPTVGEALADHLHRGYLMALLQTPTAFQQPEMPWLPTRIRPSPTVSKQLLDQIRDLTGWAGPNSAVADETRARLTVVVAQLAESLGWAAGPAEHLISKVIAGLDSGALRRLLTGGTPLLAGGWPPIPRTLLRYLEQDLVRHLGDRPILANPGALEILDQIAGPLQVTPDHRPVLAIWGVLGWERAAAILQVTGMPADAQAPPGRPDAELLGAAAVLRALRPDRAVSIADRDVVRAVWHDRLPLGVSRLSTLLDLVDAIQSGGTGYDPLPLVDLGLGTITPTPDSVGLAKYVLNGRATPMQSAIEFHLALRSPLPTAPWLGEGRDRQPNRPQADEIRMLDALIHNRMHQAVRDPGLDRLAWWVLIQPPEYLLASTNRPAWLDYTIGRPLGEAAYLKAANLIADLLERTDNRDGSADLLAAQWVVRACLPDAFARHDPARDLFRGGERRQPTWTPIARRLLRADARDRNELMRWVDQVEALGLRIGRQFRIGGQEDAAAEEFTAICTKEAARLAEVQTRRLLRKMGPSRK